MKRLFILILTWLSGTMAAYAQPLTDVQLSTEFDRLLSGQFKPGESGCTAFPETETKFFFKAMDAQLEFIRDAADKVVKRSLTYSGQKTEAKKIQ
ncbi:hypothetical protein [Dyadobacter sp. NIV53]|uniref:hypothetical protein n=1 Tax=Dyadobacter sp. NIV53 TaxID=2861765 RepID=UPI001C87EB18|nr:hypothetical protein [Dyadobacter sp. NIV53]